MNTGSKARGAAFDAEYDRTFQKHYDLELLSQKLKKGDQIERVILGLFDTKAVRIFLQQLEQILILFQNSNSEMSDAILDRYAALQAMYYVEAIKTEINDLITKKKKDEVIDINVEKNFD